MCHPGQRTSRQPGDDEVGWREGISGSALEQPLEVPRPHAPQGPDGRQVSDCLKREEPVGPVEWSEAISVDLHGIGFEFDCNLQQRRQLNPPLVTLRRTNVIIRFTQYGVTTTTASTQVHKA